MSRPNEAVVKTIKGYNLIRSKKKGEIFMNDPGGVNFSISLEVMREIVRLADTDADFKKKMNL